MIQAIDYWCNGVTQDFAARWGAAASRLELGRSSTLQGALDEVASPRPFVPRLMDHGLDAVIIPAVYAQSADDHPQPAMGFEDVWSTVDEVAELSHSYPGRVFGMCSINPYTGMAGVRRSRAIVEDHKFIAMHLHTHSWDKPLDDRDYYPYYSVCAELQLPIVAQVGHSADLRPSECGRPMTLDRAALYFPEVSFVMSHIGWPWVDEAIALASKHKNVYIGTATHPPRRWPDSLIHFAQSRGSAKVLFGTGFPVLHPQAALDEVRGLALDEAVEQRIIRDNARRIFDLKDPSSATP